jgi:hypothetical protein
VSRVYSLSEFTSAPSVYAVENGGGSGAAVNISGNLPRLASLEELPDKVTARTKMLIVEGVDPDQPAKYPSRSEIVWAVVCQLVRAGCTDDEIAAVLLDRNYRISEHILAQGNPRRYAARQIMRARAAPVDFIRTAEDTIICNYANARIALIMLGLELRYNRFTGRYQVGGKEPQEWLGDEVSDQVISMLRQCILERFGFDPRKDHVRDAAVQLCLEGAYDPVVDYLANLSWDGVSRIDNWLTSYVGADDTVLNRAFGRKILLAAVRRARHPGVKFDFIPVLEGVQGSGKSSAIQILAGDDFYSDATLLDKSTQEQQELLAGVWIFEIADLVGMRRAGIEEIKAFASRTHDRARPAYGHFREDQPRRCILIATTNNDTYLNDPTGNRRFWPIKTAKIDLALLAGDRDQLWAEAAHIEAQGESLNLPAELWNAAAEATDLRRAQDPWEGSLSSLRSNTDCGDERVSTSDILSQLDIPPGLQSVAHAQRLGPIMRSLGWNGPKTIRINGKAQKGYQRSLEGAHGNAPF